ncbi:hypothetical protein DNI75_23745 [Salmonella enterica subsp. enterica]|nr:hypothetical protein [Salmonella enterica subsp. enterica]EDW4592654.1 hypothetical protein [Salmonella enterica subsp. enterica serovar Java]EHB2725126.1 hypothetical protein [Salmonella enterica subsp. enterica serovar 4,[5],12:b:-]ECC8814792.1 hypothetical protein [Salmonella enterica subsp. enterica]ECC9251779.1 hypothetical protein [Salmonella enterica subsp. enterica]
MDKHTTWLAYIWALISGICAQWTLNDYGALIGIVLGIGTFLVNKHYKKKAEQAQTRQAAAMEERNRLIARILEKNDHDSTLKMLAVRAGGRLIFEGDITDAYADYNQAPDIPLILTGQVSFNLRNQTAADFSAKGDVPVADIIRALASSAGLKFENQGVSRSLSNPHFSGNLVQQMLDAASAADINIDLGDAEKVTIWPKDKALDIPAVHISPDHGLIGYPVYTMTGLSATTTFCPDLFIGRRVHLESSLPNVTGDYQLTGVIHTITSRTVGGPWSSNCTMTRLNDNGTTTQ